MRAWRAAVERAEAAGAAVRLALSMPPATTLIKGFPRAIVGAHPLPPAAAAAEAASLAADISAARASRTLLAGARAVERAAWAEVARQAVPGGLLDLAEWSEPRRYRRRVGVPGLVERTRERAVSTGRWAWAADHGGGVPNCYDYPAWSQAVVVVAWPDGTAIAADRWIPANKITYGGVLASVVGEAARPLLDGRWPKGHPREVEAQLAILRWAGQRLGRDIAAEEAVLRERLAARRAERAAVQRERERERREKTRAARWARTISRLAHQWAAGIPIYRWTRPDRARWERACSEERTRQAEAADAEARRLAPSSQDLAILWGGGGIRPAGRDMGSRAAALDLD